MKKIALFSIIMSLTFIFGAFAEDLPDWTKKTEPWTEAFEQEYVYAVGTANYRDNMPETEFNSNYDSARAIAIGKIKDFLKVQQLIGYQIIDQEYQEPKMYVLIAAPKALNKVTALAPPPPPPPSPATITDENALLEKAILESNILPTKAMPDDWWNLYNEGVKAFRFGPDIYAIGWTKLNPQFASNPSQQKNLAERGAEESARRNLLNAVKPVIRKFRGKGNWTTKISGIVAGAVTAKNVAKNPYLSENGGTYVLITIPISRLKDIR